MCAALRNDVLGEGCIRLPQLGSLALTSSGVDSWCTSDSKYQLLKNTCTECTPHTHMILNYILKLNPRTTTICAIFWQLLMSHTKKKICFLFFSLHRKLFLGQRCAISRTKTEWVLPIYFFCLSDMIYVHSLEGHFDVHYGQKVILQAPNDTTWKLTEMKGDVFGKDSTFSNSISHLTEIIWLSWTNERKVAARSSVVH